MKDEKVTVLFNILKRNIVKELEIPLDISANELVNALNMAYDLEIEISDVKQCYLKSENPIALLKGTKKLSEYGIRNGTVIYYTN